jgi:SAM-dependent methyltransferase
VPSFEQLFPQELREEAQYWSDWYGFFWDQGYTGFFDLRSPVAHLISRGIEVPDPRSLDGHDLDGTHAILAAHPLVSGAERILDVGCGCGWSSLYLARRGHKVVAFDPSADNVRRAKLYAISRCEYVEYIAAGLGYLSFEPETFDAVFALHSIHHVPDLRNEAAELRGWLREGGAIAVDEHIRSDPTLLAMVGEVEKWFGREIAPRFSTLPVERLGSLPRSAHSRLEDAGSAEVVGALTDNFAIQSFSSRCVSLDIFSFMYYLWRDLDLDAYSYAGEVVDHLYTFMQGAHPDRAEYVTMVGRKSGSPGPATPEIARAMLAVLGDANPSQVLTGMHGGVTAQLLKEAEDLEAALAVSTAAIETLQSTIASLNQVVHDKNAYIAHLESAFAGQEREIARKQATLESQAELLKRIEQGRIMRLVNALTFKRPRKPERRLPRPEANA